MADVDGDGRADIIGFASAYVAVSRATPNDDTLIGGAGNDTLDGGAGIDSMVGGVGNDIYIVDNADDVVSALAGAGIDEVRTTLAAYTLTANVENLSYTGSGNFNGAGNALDNVLIGGNANDTLAGGVGNDTLIGGAGTDNLIGGVGDDVYVVDNAGDVVSELAGEGTDDVHTSLNVYSLSANVENLTFIGSGAFTGTGNNSANSIQGGVDNDTLDGGSGADLFAFVSGDCQDTITDFDAAQGDRIGLAAGQSYSVDTNANTVIVYGTSDIVTLGGIQPAAVSGTWFVTL